MQSHADKAEAIFATGLNCAQAVFGAYAEEYGMDEKTALLVTSSLGGGLGHAGEVCGAVLGAVMAVGMEKGYIDASNAEVKKAHSDRIKQMVEDFRAKFGTSACEDLFEKGNRAVCIPYVRYAAEMVEQERSRP